MIWRCAICEATQERNTIRCEQCGQPMVFPARDAYILDGHEPVPVDRMTWARWFESADRQVAESIQGDVRVSTVFLGLDQNFGDLFGLPILFETMVFVNGESQACDRYRTWDEAEAGHQRWVKQVFKATPILALPTSGDEHG